MYFDYDWDFDLRTCWTAHSLGQVSAGAGLLGPVRLGDAECVAQCRYAGLQVELGGLREIRLLAKVVEVKKRGATLHLSLHQCGRSDLDQEKSNTQNCQPFTESFRPAC